MPAGVAARMLLLRLEAVDVAAEITVVGLGPGPWDLMSVRAAGCLEQAGRARLVLRTGRHPVAQELERRGLAFVTLDDHYERYPTFDEVYLAMARTLVGMARQGPVVYGVPGHPLVGEASVRHLLALSRSEAVQVEVVVSPGSAEAIWADLGVDPLEAGAAVVDAHELSRWARRPEELAPAAGRAWERSRGYLVLQLDSQLVAQEVKAVLSAVFGDEHRVALVQAAGGPGRVRWLRLFELDRAGPFDHLTSLYVPPAPPASAGEWVEVLVRVMAALRGPEGCPWDRQQTRETLRRYLIEEAYETVAAIERSDPSALREELGDLLLQVVFQSQLGFEQGEFGLAEVAQTLRDKLVRRHPHVFGEMRVKDAAEVLRNWEAIKQQERSQAQGQGAEPAPGSWMDGVTFDLPALALAEAVQRRAARVGFEWREISGAGKKAVEEAQELREAWIRQDKENLHREMGDLLFALVNVCRYMRVDPELALRDAVRRFMARFRRMEELARSQGLKLEELSLEAQDELWRVAKQQLQA